MTVAENLVLSRGQIPAIVDWEKEYAELRAFMRTTPFFIPITRRSRRWRPGEKQKLEIVQAALPEEQGAVPRRADQRADAAGGGRSADDAQERIVQAGELTVLMITHKFREVMKYAELLVGPGPSACRTASSA